MTTVEFLKYQIDAAAGQVTRALNGIDASHKDFRLHDGGFTLGEQVVHLAEAYCAVLAAAEGNKYEWGSFKPASEEWGALVSETLALRARATEVVLVDDEEKLKLGADYIVGHDSYHIGQIATMRLQIYPEWDSFEIYG